jgi:protein-L-isoaspartate(D-aspartate) O-methyltransferase
MHPPPERNPDAERMVSLQIKCRGVTDERVLDAMRRVPRHLFVPPGGRGAAYEDHPIGIGHGQTISQPYMVAVMTESLALRGGERVLEVGTGSGYQTAVLAELCAEVFSVERIPELAEQARRTLGRLGCANVTLRIADGSEGWPERAPFDRIIVTAAAPRVPAALTGQLADNGLLVIPVGDWRRGQELMVAHRRAGAVTVEHGLGCRFVPLIGTGGFPENEAP